jgi:uncharacterized Tic20 family protein
VYAPPPLSGRFSWALGFLAFIPIPYLGLAVAGIVMWATYPARSRNPNPLVRENARHAANWGITVLLAVALIFSCFVVLMTMEWARTAGFFPIGWTVLVFAALAIVHFVVTIAGTVAGATRVFRGLGIPFIRG